MSSQNKQFRNVGNLGDIIKHGALVSLTELLLLRAKRLVWVDTNAFLLEAACPDPAGWKHDTDRELAEHPNLQRYVTLERDLTGPSPYRCSTGLVIDAVRKAGHEAPALILGESDRTTREDLKIQLAREGLTPHALIEDARALREVAPPTGAQALLALVDPFVLEDSLWADVSVGLARLADAVVDALVLVFTYDSGRDRVDWPQAPAGFTGPVAVTHRRPFHLALYTSRSVGDVAVEQCVALGWKVARTAGKPGTSAAHDGDGAIRVTMRGFSFLKTIDDGRLVEAIGLAAARLPHDVRASLFHQRRFQERIAHLNPSSRSRSQLEPSHCWFAPLAPAARERGSASFRVKSPSGTGP